MHKKSPFPGEMLDRRGVPESNSGKRIVAFTKYAARGVRIQTQGVGRPVKHSASSDPGTAYVSCSAGCGGSSG